MSSDCDEENKATCTFEANEAIALRFPYPLVSDDSDDDEVLNYYPKDSLNINHVDKHRTIAGISSDDDVKVSEENESYKHKKRKSMQQANFKSTKIKDEKEVKSAKSKYSALITDKQRNRQASSTKNASHNLGSDKCKKSSRVTNDNASTSITVSPKKCNIPIPKTKNSCTITKKSKAKTRPPEKLKPGNSGYTSDDNIREVSQNTRDIKSTSYNTRIKLERNTNSRFLDSSSEEEVLKKPFSGHKFKRLKLMSSSSSSSESEQSKNRVKAKMTHFLSTSSSCSDKEESIDTKNTIQQAQKPASDVRQTKLGLRVNKNVHSISSSSDSDDNNEYHSVPTTNNSKHIDPIKEFPLLSSSIQQIIKSPESQHSEKTKENQNHVKPGNIDINKTQVSKKIKNNQVESNLNSDVWKNIAKVQFKRPKSSSMHQSYLHNLRKQFISSNNPSVEIHKKIIDKRIDKRDNIELGKSCSKSKTKKKDLIQGERQNICITSNPQNLSGETSTLDNDHDNKKSIDLNINMNVQIICTPSLVENTNSVDNRISTKSPSENYNKAVTPELSLSLTHKENEIPLNKQMQLSCITENKEGKSKYIASNKLKSRTQHQQKLLKHNQTKPSGSKDLQNILQTENKGIKSKSENKVFIENNESGNDLLSNILLEMDNNPFKVQKVLPKKALEPPIEMLGWGSSPPDLQPSKLHSPVNLQSSEKENELINNEIQLKNKLACPHQAIFALGPSNKSPAISQIDSSIINKLENSLKNFQKSKQHKNTLLNKKKNSVKNPKKTLDTAIASFYSVNSEDYNRPPEIPNDKYAESNCYSIPNTSNEDSTPQIQTLNENSVTLLCKEITNPIKNKKLMVERRITEIDKLSHSVRNIKSTSNDHSSSEQNVHNNCIETKDSLYLGNKTSAKRNLKDKAYIQCVIDKLTKGQTNSKPSSEEKSLVSGKVTNISFPWSKNNLNLGNAIVNPPEESTIPLEIGTINHCAASNKEIQKIPDKEHDIVSDSKYSKGIRIRLGGNVYRLPGKENVIDSNLKVNKQKEIIHSTMIENKHQKDTKVSSHKSLNNNTLSNPRSGNTESESGKSSSSSEDSSNDSSSSDSGSEDKLVVSEKSSSGTSSSESTSDDEKKKLAIENMKGSCKTLTEEDINKDHNKEINHENINVGSNSSKLLKLNEPPKEKIKCFSLDELLGFHEINKINATISIESSCKILGDDTIMLSSSSESESNEGTNNSICKSKIVENKTNTVLGKSSENSSETSGIVSKNQNPNLNVPIENKVCKIRVRSLEELGISNACPVPDNALQPSTSESKEQSWQATNTVDILNPPCSEKVDSVAQEKSRIQPSFRKGKKSLSKRGTKKQKLTVQPVQDGLNKTLNKPNIDQSDSFSSAIKICKPKSNLLTTNGKSNRHSSTKRKSRVSTKQPNLSKPNVCSPKTKHILIKPSDVSLRPSVANVSAKTLKAFITPSALNPPFPRSTVIAMVSVPDVNHTPTEATTPSSSVSDQHQNINQPQSESTVNDVHTMNPNEQTDFIKFQQTMESFFFKLCDELFSEIVMMKLPKLVDDLHLVIAHDIMREERLKKIHQLKCPETKEEEKKRTKKEFTDMLKIRGQGFVPLFMTIVRKVEKENIKTLIIAFYCKIVHQLEQIDPINHNYRFKLRLLIKDMLMKNHINQDICDIFSDNIASFTSNFYFIESLLMKYDNFVIKRNQSANQNTPHESNDGGTEQIRSHTENYENINNSESSITQVGKMGDTVIVYSAQPSTSEQTIETTHDSSCKDLLTQPLGRTSNLPPVGNLDQMLFGAFCKKATSHKS